MPERKAIRLRASVRTGNQLIDNNAVVDALPEVADDLVGRGVAEFTDAVERHPNHPLLDHVDDVLVSGSEKFPKPAEIKRPAVELAATGTEVDRNIAALARSEVGPTYDHPAKTGDESSPAKVPAVAPKGDDAATATGTGTGTATGKASDRSSGK